MTHNVAHSGSDNLVSTMKQKLELELETGSNMPIIANVILRLVQKS